MVFKVPREAADKLVFEQEAKEKAKKEAKIAEERAEREKAKKGKVFAHLSGGGGSGSAAKPPAPPSASTEAAGGVEERYGGKGDEETEEKGTYYSWKIPPPLQQCLQQERCGYRRDLSKRWWCGDAAIRRLQP